MKTKTLNKIALGGGCHWCTEAVFLSLRGVDSVEQGYVASVGEHTSFSEAVVIHFNVEEISLRTLIEIHLHTHKSTSAHSMRDKYRSAVYTFSKKQSNQAEEILKLLQTGFDKKLITKVYPFSAFKSSREQLLNYYYSNPNKPFCETFINPKLQLLLEQFAVFVK